VVAIPANHLDQMVSPLKYRYESNTHWV